MPSVEVLFGFAIAYIVMLITPGPAVAAVIARASVVGARRTAPFILGIGIGDGLIFTAAAAGLAAMAAALGDLFMLLKWVGAAYLLYLAYKLWRAPAADAVAPAMRGEGVKLFGLGLALTLGNPKALAFFLALLPALIDLPSLTVAGGAVIGGLMLTCWCAVGFGYAFAASRARKAMSGVRAVKAMNRAAAGMMAAAAAAIAARG